MCPNLIDQTFKKADQVANMSKKSAARIASDPGVIGPQLLLQWPVTARLNCGYLKQDFKFKLCSYPAVLIDSPMNCQQFSWWNRNI